MVFKQVNITNLILFSKAPGALIRQNSVCWRRYLVLAGAGEREGEGQKYLVFYFFFFLFLSFFWREFFFVLSWKN